MQKEKVTDTCTSVTFGYLDKRKKEIAFLKRTQILFPFFFFFHLSGPLPMGNDSRYFIDTVPASGIRILHISTRENGGIAHVQVDVRTGSDDETMGVKFESAHFLEHLIAQLTSKKDERDSIEIARDLERRGIVWNAFTAPHRTGYYLSGPGESFDVMVEVLMNAFFNFKLDSQRIFENEKVAVQQELMRLASRQSYPMMVIRSKFLYPNHPRSATVVERLESVEQITMSDLESFRNDFYANSEILITLASPLSDEDGRRYVEDRLKGDLLSERTLPEFRRERVRDFPLLKLSATETSDVIAYVRNENVINSRISVTFRVPYAYFDDLKRYSMVAISMILTGGFSSRLYERLRTIGGLVYSVSSHPFLDYLDSRMSTFTIDTSTNNERVGEGIRAILDEISQLGREGISEREFEKYQNRIGFRFSERELNTHPGKWVSKYTESLLWHRPIELESQARSDAFRLKKAEIDAVAKEIFLHSRQIVVVYGGPENFNEIIEEQLNRSFNLNTNRISTRLRKYLF